MGSDGEFKAGFIRDDDHDLMVEWARAISRDTPREVLAKDFRASGNSRVSVARAIAKSTEKPVRRRVFFACISGFRDRANGLAGT